MKSLWQFQITITFFLLVSYTPTYSQQGCTDPLANNFDSTASINNGSCTYNNSNYSPRVKVRTLNSVLNESGGLQMADNFLWSFNDGGGEAALYRIDTITGSLLQTVYLQNATNVDWEDIGFDGKFFYIGDFGNNLNGARTDLKIYKFPLSAIPGYKANPIVTIPAEKIEVISFKYQNQLIPTASPVNSTRFDCEAMIVDDGKIHLFSKNWVDINTTHYVINNTVGGAYIADSVETMETGYLVTAADKAPGKDIVVFLGYFAKAPGKHFLHILADYSSGNYFNGNKRKVDLPSALRLGQAEGITFRKGTYGYISNEKLTAGPFTIKQKLHSFDISGFVKVAAKLRSE